VGNLGKSSRESEISERSESDILPPTPQLQCSPLEVVCFKQIKSRLSTENLM